jgi:hypothetical protein
MSVDLRGARSGDVSPRAERTGAAHYILPDQGKSAAGGHPEALGGPARKKTLGSCDAVRRVRRVPSGTP